MYQLTSITAGIFALYIFAAAVVAFIFNPFQFYAIPQLSLLVSLIYIPAGVRVFATILFGAQAVPGIFLGTIFAAYFLSGVENSIVLVCISVVSAAVAPIVFYGLSRIGINAYYLRIEDKLPKGGDLLLAGFLTAALNGFLLATILETLTDLTSITFTMAGIIIGDFVGTLVVILLARLTTGTDNNNH